MHFIHPVSPSGNILCSCNSATGTDALMQSTSLNSLLSYLSLK